VSSTDLLHAMVNGQKQGKGGGIYSICSANRFVLEASIMQAAADGTAVCIESTSNQVNQFGGYTGMTAKDFAAYVGEIAAQLNFPADRIILGGDHLGPNAWQKEPSKAAMEKALELVRSCVLAGYTKIHLDASMRCADDPGDKNTPLAEETVTRRAAEMCAAAEEAFKQLPASSPAPVYIIGTEVPIPGGEQAAQSGIAVTTTADAQRTIARSRAAFDARGLQRAWERVIGVVVQPGVEFSDSHVFGYQRDKARSLRKIIEGYDYLVFEAHSTDYQTPEALRELVEDHFAILKVGPWLTYALREAIFALADMERHWLSHNASITLSRLPEVLEEVMLENQNYWKPYYHGDDAYLRFARKFSYSDRARYYWPQPKLHAAVNRLVDNLTANPVPLTLLSQYLPRQYDAVRAGQLRNHPRSLIHSKIMEVTGYYAAACRQ
jgi:D-tagatose-1,6-bisphosphate aldolase subunit GatZ/KbaZ